MLETDDTNGRPLAHAPHSGYARLEQGPAVVIVDVGRPPAPGLNKHAASAPLAFEFSDRAHRVIVNCGAPAFAGTEWDAACRMTAAASTAEIGGVSSGRIISGRLVEALFGTPVLIGPRDAQASVKLSAEGSLLEARHDGYGAASGYAMKGGCSWRRTAATSGARTGLSASAGRRNSTSCPMRCGSIFIRR